MGVLKRGIFGEFGKKLASQLMSKKCPKTQRKSIQTTVGNEKKKIKKDKRCTYMRRFRSKTKKKLHK